MRILVTGAAGTLGRGTVSRLRSAGHELVLSDLHPLPTEEPFDGLPSVPVDVRSGVGLEVAAAGCDLILHLPAWHGIHKDVRSEVDFWRLNVDGTFWMLQAARRAKVERVVFLSSQAWHDRYDKYGFTKRVGEDLCEYHRLNHGLRYVAIRPGDFTPWASFTDYGTRLLYWGVDRDDVLDCVEAAVRHLAEPPSGEPEGIAVEAVRANAFTAAQLEGWEDDPVGTCDRLFAAAGELIERYGLDLAAKPLIMRAGDGGSTIGYEPSHHFGTFLEELRRLDDEIGQRGVNALRCPY